jgi:uncharacterized protein
MASPSLFYLPTTLSYNDHQWTLEHAITSKEKQLGLMHRLTYPSDNAMLFVYEEPQPISVWMKNTYIPLDILWLDKDFTVLAIEEGMPLSRKILSPTVNADYLLEIKGGLSSKLKLNVGNSLFCPSIH